MMNRRYAELLVVLFAMLFLASCASLQSFDKRWQTASEQNTALRTAATSAVTSKAISPTEAREVLKLNDDASNALSEARKTKSTDKLNEAEKAIAAAKAMLEKRGVKQPPKSS